MAPEELSGTAQPRLRRLRVVREAGQNVYLILIPGVGTLQSDAWAICSTTPWADFLAELEQGVTVVGYEHHIPYDDQFTWQHVLEEGPGLLTALQAFVTELSAPQPLLFISHGLGGAMLKQALCIANMHYSRYSQLLVSISGLVFLGTPHLLEGVGNHAFGERLVSIMKLDDAPGLLSNKCLTRLKESSHILADLAHRFNRTNLRVDMLSVFEQKVTRIRESAALRRSKTKKIIIVDESLCAIATRTEQCLGVDLDHLQLPSMSDSDGKPLRPIGDWLASVINSAPKNLESQLSRDRIHRASSASSGLSMESLGVEDVRQALARQLPVPVSSYPSNPNTSTYVNLGSSSRGEIESLLDSFSIKQADPRIPCFMMETLVRNKSFFGRQKVLEDLDKCLLPSRDLLVSSQPDRIRVGLLCGMGGLGKTEVAVEYAYSRQDAFDAIFWVRAEDTSKLESDLAQIAVRLGIQDPNEPDDKVINRGLAIEWLCNPFKVDHGASNPGRVAASWLVIFDNADEPDILAPYRDIVASGAVLITSRSPLARTSLSPQTTEIDIQSFSTDEAAEFVQSLTGIAGHLDEARQIGARLGGLPLALAQMAGIIRLEFLSYAEFLELYDDKEEAADVHGTVLQPLRESARGSLSTVWAIEKLSASARAVLEVASFLDPDCIQESLLTHEAGAIDNLIPEFPTKRLAFFAARKQLIGSSLIRHNKELAEYWLHRVTQDVVRGKMAPARLHHVFANAVAIVSAAWPATAVGGHDVRLWELSEKLYQHVTSLSDMYVRYIEPGDETLDMAFATLLNRAGWYQHERGESRIQIPLLELALELCQGIDNIDTRDLESDIRYALGAVANETNDAASCRLHTERFFEIRREIAAETGTVDERLARSYNQMGIVWMMAGEYKKAEESFATSAREYEKIPGYTKDKRSLALVNLGLAHWLQGDLDSASEVLELGLADREELYGYMDTHSFRTGRFLHALGNVRFSQGRIQESEDLHSRALKQYQSTIRNHHHRTADVCHKMAQHCIRKGLLNEALGFIGQALKVWNVDADKYAPEIARTSFLKAKALFSAGSEDEATRLFRSAASTRRRLLKLEGKSEASEKDDKALTEADFDELVMFWSR